MVAQEFPLLKTLAINDDPAVDAKLMFEGQSNNVRTLTELRVCPKAGITTWWSLLLPVEEKTKKMIAIRSATSNSSNWNTGIAGCMEVTTDVMAGCCTTTTVAGGDPEQTR